MIEGAMEKPIDEIRYPNVAKKTRRLMILATKTASGALRSVPKGEAWRGEFFRRD